MTGKLAVAGASCRRGGRRVAIDMYSDIVIRVVNSRRGTRQRDAEAALYSTAAGYGQ